MRAAVFYVPEDDDPLAAAGASWLGYDMVGSTAVPQPSPKLECVTKTPARYGFHATLKPPMRLATNLEALSEDVARLAARFAPFALPPLRVGRMGNALALLAAPSAQLRELCDACVEVLDPHRLPADADEIARRREAGLSPEEEAMLARWGYPYVFDRWRFHMTLTSKLPAKVIDERERLACGHFAESLAVPRIFSSLALCVAPSPGSNFVVTARFPLLAH